MGRIRSLLPLVMAAVVLPSGVMARSGDAVMTPHAEVRLVSDVDAVAAGETFRLGLHFRLKQGWHVYWVNPGAAGEAPRLDLTLPGGASASDFVWPTPRRLPDGPVMTYGYVDEVLLPLEVTTSSVTPAGLPVTARASWLICEKICIPEEGTFRLDLPAGTPAPSASAPLFRQAAAKAPRPSPFAATVSPGGALTLTGEGIAPAAIRDAWFLPSGWGTIDDAAPQPLTVADGSLTLALRTGPAFQPADGIAGTVVVVDRSGAETYLAVEALPVAAPLQAETLGLATILGLAFLGGLILNLMPCVFPILAMKAIGLAGLSGRERSAVRAHAASYVAGVLLGFAVLGGLLIALRAAGAAAGWGFQFQSPVFVAATAWLLFAIGLNLSGVFEVSGRFAGAGGRLAALGGHAGSLFTGLLVVIVATPCTAPFMGAAVAAAAVSPPAVTMAIFAALGLGLAAPYGMLGLAPGLARLLPRPGRWMGVLKQALAFPMYGAAAWLAWVVSEQAGPPGVLVVMSGALLVALAAWLVGATQGTGGDGRTTRLLARAAAILSLAAVVALLGAPASVGLIARPSAAVASAGDASFAPYSADRLAALRSEGRPVFVNMTAAWCVTCIVNERVVLATDAVREAFAARGVAYLKGDWTSADPAITDYLRARGRDGVPLYVYYPPKGDAVVLPQILTVGLVLDELDRPNS